MTESACCLSKPKYTDAASEDGVCLALPAARPVRAAGGVLGRGPHGAPAAHAVGGHRQEDDLHYLRHRQDAGAQEQAHLTAQVA